MKYLARSEIWWFAGLLLLVAPAGSPVQAQDTPTQYQFTINQVDLCTDTDCTVFVVMTDTPQTFDVGSASVGAGDVAGLMGTSFNLPEGGETFTQIRITVVRDFTITATSGFVTSGGGSIFRTTATVTSDSTVSTNGAATIDVTADLASTKFVVPDSVFGFAGSGVEKISDTMMRVTGKLPFAFSANSIPDFDVAFDVTNKIQFASQPCVECTATFSAPVASMTIK